MTSTDSPPHEARHRSHPTGSNRIAVLPLGAHEQHGPHLPFETDAIIADGVAALVREHLPADLDVTFLPTERVGYSIEHSDAPATRSLAYAGAVERWIGIGESLARIGVRKFVMLNAHGGNAPLMTVVATELRVRLGMLAVATSWTRFGYPDGLVTENERAIGIHGGFIETSVMLALRPDLVEMGKARDFTSRQSDFIQDFTHLRAYGPHAFGWMMCDLSPDGVAGNAASATAEAGRAMLNHAVAGFIDLLHDVARFDMGVFDPLG